MTDFTYPNQHIEPCRDISIRLQCPDHIAEKVARTIEDALHPTPITIELRKDCGPDDDGYMKISWVVNW